MPLFRRAMERLQAEQNQPPPRGMRDYYRDEPEGGYQTPHHGRWKGNPQSMDVIARYQNQGYKRAGGQWGPTRNMIQMHQAFQNPNWETEGPMVGHHAPEPSWADSRERPGGPGGMPEASGGRGSVMHRMAGQFAQQMTGGRPGRGRRRGRQWNIGKMGRRVGQAMMGGQPRARSMAGSAYAGQKPTTAQQPGQGHGQPMGQPMMQRGSSYSGY